MTHQKLTMTRVTELPFATGKPYYVRDTEITGFGIMVGKIKKSYIVEARVNGLPRRARIGDAAITTIMEARKRAKLELAAMADGVDRNAEKAKQEALTKPLNRAIAEFFESRDLKPKTRYDYERVLGRCFPDWMGKQLRSITPNLFVQRFDEVRSNSGDAYATLALRSFSSVWNHTRAATADADGIPILPESPTNRVKALKKTPKPVRRKRHVKDFPKFRAALDTVRSDGFRLYFEFLLLTGLRRSEASNLRWSDVDDGFGTFTLRDTKNGTDHTLPISRQIEAILEQLRERHGACEYVWGDKPMGDPRKSLDAFCEAYGERLSCHDLRRTFTNVAQFCDVSDNKMKALLNHSDQTVTHGYLVSDDPERLRPQMQQISDWIEKAQAS